MRAINIPAKKINSDKLRELNLSIPILESITIKALSLTPSPEKLMGINVAIETIEKSQAHCITFKLICRLKAKK